jgi:anti-sigma factor RsiW
MSGDGRRHCADSLAELAAGVLAAPERAAAAAHLADCPSCRAALAGWAAVAASTAAVTGAPRSAQSIVRAVLTQAALDPQPPPVHKRRAGFAGQLLRAEFQLVRPAVWVASVLVMACAVVLAAVGGDDAGGGVLSLVAPLVAVGGVAGSTARSATQLTRRWRRR